MRIASVECLPVHSGWRKNFVFVRLATDDPARWEGHKFVWREAGSDAYAKLIGKTLVPPVAIPNGTFAWFADVDGNTVGLWKPAVTV